MRSEKLMITPELAKEYLKLNKKNRAMNKNLVNTYVHDMVTQNWIVNGETIKFDLNGDLIDGQHRLAAIIQSGVSIEYTCIFDLPEKAFSTIDIGRRRTMGDTLSAVNIPSSSSMAALAKRMLQYDKGYSIGNAQARVNIGITNNDIIEFVNENQDIMLTHVNSAKTYHQTFRGLNNGDYAFYSYLFSRIDAQAAENFFNILTGVELAPVNNPVTLLRNRLINNMGMKTKMNKVLLSSYVVKAWNYHRNSAEITRLVITDKDYDTIAQ